eukprot:Tbor_TRINITY_DN9132_c0_g1::TRINITY_DN9132_c0_g1_i1::g.14463::m.14463
MSSLSLIILLQHPYEAFMLSRELSQQRYKEGQEICSSSQQESVMRNSPNNIIVKSAFVISGPDNSSVSLKGGRILQKASKRGRIVAWEMHSRNSDANGNTVSILGNRFFYDGPRHTNSVANSKGLEIASSTEPIVNACRREEFYDIISSCDNCTKDSTESPPKVKIWIAVPDEATAVLDYLLPWSYACYREQVRQYYWRVRMAKAMTFGGGWASIRNPVEALRYAILLNDSAEQLKDLATIRKCKVFRGWAYLWMGNRVASTKIFKEQMFISKLVGDTVNKNRCGAALTHSKWNTTLPKHKGSHLELPDIEVNWTEAFAVQL